MLWRLATAYTRVAATAARPDQNRLPINPKINFIMLSMDTYGFKNEKSSYSGAEIM
jgi:hypothetical protein